MGQVLWDELHNKDRDEQKDDSFGNEIEVPLRTNSMIPTGIRI